MLYWRQRFCFAGLGGRLGHSATGCEACGWSGRKFFGNFFWSSNVLKIYKSDKKCKIMEPRVFFWLQIVPGGLGVGWSWGGVFRWFCSISLANGFLEFSISILMGFSKGSRNRDVRFDELSAASGVHFLWFQKFGRAVHRQFRFFLTSSWFFALCFYHR